MKKKVSKKYSNNDINKAGLVLAALNNDFSKEKAYDILKYFRESHEILMYSFRILLMRKIKKIKGGRNISISQRLKRAPSIIQKIKNNRKMKLSRMQDVAGLRVVVNKISDVYLLNEELKKAENAPNFKSLRKRETDYIQGNSPGPKESGYRSLHIIYQNENIRFGKLNAEIQIRTKLQHAWATSVEIMGTYLNQPLKQSIGNLEILELFKKISIAFKIYEDGGRDINLSNEIKLEIDNQNLINKLKGFKKVTEIYASSKRTGKYFLIQLNFYKKTLSLSRFSEKELESANKKYIELEQKFKNDTGVEIVLVSVQDIKKLKEMYPNYYLDAEEFISFLDKVL